MKIYLGGHSYTHKHVRKKHYLLSYFYIGKKERGLIPKLAPLFLDSGAFSAWRRGSIINIKEYMAFIREYEKYLGVYANLDVIGDDKATMDNQRIMESEGLKPLPTYHRSEDEYYLERYLETHSHIALGGMVGDTPTVLADWLDRVWDNYLLRSDGTPKVKVHGFGVTSLRILKRYPWY